MTRARSKTRRIAGQLTGGFWLGLPNKTERRGHVHCRNFVYGTIEQLLAIGVTEVAFPLMAGFRTDGFFHRIPDDELGDVPEGRNRLGVFPRGPVGLDRVEPAGNELPRLGAPFSSVLEADGGIGAETFVLPNTSNLIAQDLFLTARLAHDEV